MNAKQMLQADSTILIVDDEPLFLNALGELLRPHYHVRVATSGERALAALSNKPRPDLILLDVMMQKMDGFEVMRRIQADESLRDIPVIFITALHDDDSEQHGLALGAADYVHKPLKNLTILSRVRAQLDAKAAREMLRKNNLRLTDQVAQGACALEQAQEQLLQAEKMAAMGQLAAGIAHEINNPVGFIGSNLTTLETYLQDIFAIVGAYEHAAALESGPAFDTARAMQRDLDFDFIKKDTVDLLAESRDGIGRVRQIVRDLKDFSRMEGTDWQWADLHKGLDSTLNIVWNELKYHCVVTKNYGVLPKVNCLPNQLNQVFMNLLMNAAQAMAERGTIIITTEPIGDAAVRISIEDNGRGIPAASLSRIFDPFYTTKPIGQGTGLGLSLSASIIDHHHGSIEVTSEVGKTVFAITLPVDCSRKQNLSPGSDDR